MNQAEKKWIGRMRITEIITREIDSDKNSVSEKSINIIESEWGQLDSSMCSFDWYSRDDTGDK